MGLSRSPANHAARQFQAGLRNAHAQLCASIKGPRTQARQSSLASILLHRLVFVRFLQQNGFLPEEIAHTRARRPTKSRSLYRRVLMPLFRTMGLTQDRETERDLDLPDSTLEKVFAFFQRYQWVLHSGDSHGQNEISPDVFDSLLASFVDRPKTGSYYTQDDVTGFIARGAILPAFLDALVQASPGAPEDDYGGWQRLYRDPDRYILPSARHGVDLPLPPAVAVGLHDAKRRTSWEEPAPPAYGLPGETWREHMDRRQNCERVRQRLRGGTICRADELLSCNLDLTKFTTDTLTACAAPRVRKTARAILRRLSIIDPTCGSGAFVLAALRVLMPLYTACEQPPRAETSSRQVARIRCIIEHNLHGMDLLPAATELCKLRLLLEVARVSASDPKLDNLRGIKFAFDTGDALDRRSGLRSYDVVIGNPPYVEKAHRGVGFELAGTGNLFSFCTERFTEVLKLGGRLGVIVPLSAISTPRMQPLMQLLAREFSPFHIANFAVRPAKLFAGVDMNVTILLGRKGLETPGQILTTRYNRWRPAYRPHLFEALQFTTTKFEPAWATIPKIGSKIESAILSKLIACRAGLPWLDSGGVALYCHSGGRYFRKCLREPLSREYKPVRVPAEWVDALICLLSSSLYYWFWVLISDCYHLTRRDWEALPIAASLRDDSRFKQLAKELETVLWRHATRRDRRCADGRRQQEINFDMARCLPVLDRIDAVLAQHYGLSADEADFIVSFERKFRDARVRQK